MAAEKAIVSGLSGRYATALFELARDDNALETVDGDLAQLQAVLSESADFARLIASPILSRKEQAGAVAALAEKLGLSKLTANFLGVLALNRRLRALRAMIRDYAKLYAAHKGEVTADVVSARPLNKTQMKALEAKLKSVAGQDVVVNAHVDEDLIGGLIVKVGSRMIDGSIATKLDNLERAMKGV